MTESDDSVAKNQALKNNIWKLFDILRKENFSSEDYYLLLFLLVPYKDYLNVSEVTSKSQLIDIIEKHQRTNPNEGYFSQYIRMCGYFVPYIKKLSDNGFTDLLSLISKIDRKDLKENFNDVLQLISLSQGRFSDEILQPNELTRLIWNLADLENNAKIFNPFAGSASLAVTIEKDQDYLGQEINPKKWAQGFLRFLAYGKKNFSNFKREDSFQAWPEPSKKFDLIISSPPLNLNIRHLNINGKFISNYKTVEQFIVENSLNNLTEKGKLILLTGLGFIQKMNGEEHIITHLVDKDLIDSIILFPSGIFPQTNFACALLIIDKAKKYPGKVKFIDAQKFLVSKNTKKKEMNFSALNNLLGGEIEEEEGILKVVLNNEIRKRDYNLNVASYLQQEIEGVKLGDLVEIVKGKKDNLPNLGKIVRIRDLKGDNIDFYLDLNEVEETELNRTDFEALSESSLLLSLRWNSLKPTFFNFKGEAIYKNRDILSCSINESLVDTAYLVNELNADYIQDQLKIIRRGITIPFIKKDDLMKVVVKLPSLNEQRAKVQGVHELSDKIKSLQEDRNALVHGKTLNQFNEFASLKHTLGRPRQNILDWSRNLLDFLAMKKEGFESLNKSFSEFYEIDIFSALKEIKRDINFITEVLEKGENGLILSEHEKEIIPISDINIIIDELSNNGFNFKIKKQLLKGEKLKERGIYVNKTLLNTLLNNILTNANKYAFDKKSEGNEVIIELTELEDCLSMEIRNNGKPFPNNFDREKFITKYSTADLSTGSGLGGYDINRIATDFNNPNWNLSLNEDPIFPVKFSFQFPILLTN
ncbi:N-6 DNA methylase [Aquirufa sp. ROCK2-A2]